MLILGKNGQKASAPVAGPGGAASPAARIIDVTVETFEAEVINGSMKMPVLLDLWATWCEPCKTLGPILEKLAARAAGAFTLAKLDVDANPEVAQLLRVRSVPMVYLFKGGRPADGFTGALPESQVKAFLEKNGIKCDGAAAEPGTAENGAAALLGAGRVAEARAALKAAPDPLLELRATILAGDAKSGRTRVAALPADLRDANASLLESAERVLGLLESPSEKQRHAAGALAAGNVGTCLEALLEAFDDANRRLVLDLLALLGRGPFAEEYRDRLAKRVLR